MAKAPPSPSPVSGTPIGLWGLAAFVIIPATLAGLIALQSAPPPSPPVYRAEATLQVNRFSPGVLGPNSSREGTFLEEQFLPHPASITRLITTPDVVNRARSAYEKRTGSSAPPLAQLLSGVSAVNEVLADTAVRREVSPSIQVAYTSTDAKFAVEFLEDWLTAAVDRGGSVILNEVIRRSNNLSQAAGGTARSLQDAETTLSQIRARRLMVMTEWEALNGSQAPALNPPAIQSPTPAAATVKPDSGTGALSQLISRSQQLQIQASSANSPWTTSDLLREKAQVDSTLQDTRTSLSLLLRELADLDAQIARTQVEADKLRNQLAGFTESRMRYDAYREAARLSESLSVPGYPAGPELRVVAAPVLALPSRTSRPPSFWAILAAAGAGAVGLLLGLGLRRSSPSSS